MRSVVLLLACAGCYPTEISGSVAITGAPFGDVVIRPNDCSNGDTRQFYGVDLTDGDATVRLFQDPLAGWLVGVTLHGDPSVPIARFAPKGCTRWRAALQYDKCTRCAKGDHDEDDSTQSGFVDLECAWPNGGTIAGTISFQYCDNPEEK